MDVNKKPDQFKGILTVRKGTKEAKNKVNGFMLKQSKISLQLLLIPKGGRLEFSL